MGEIQKENRTAAFFITEIESGRIIAANDAALDIVGRTVDEAVGKTTVDIGIWEDIGQRNSFLACLAIEGTLVRYPVRFIGAQGRPVELFVSAEPFESDDSRFLLTRLHKEALPIDSSAHLDQDVIVRFLSRSATKFLVDEGADFYHLVSQELRSLIPNSIVVVFSYETGSLTLVPKTYSAPNSLELMLSISPESLSKFESISINDEIRESLLRGELFELPVRKVSMTTPENDELVSAALKNLDVISNWMIGLTWNGTIYGAVSLLVRIPDERPDRIAVETFVRQASVALQRNERSRALRESLHEKETLLREIHHRVKNNLQIVASLLKLQGGATQDASTLTLLGEAADRVQSMALVHTMLYDNRNLSSIDAGEFLRALLTQIIRGGRFDASAIRLEYDLETMRLDPDHAVPIGLIVNELVTNALKYGMPATDDFKLSLAFRQAGQSRELVVADSGGSLPADFKLETTRTLGMQLVASLTRQLRGSFSFSAGDETVFRVHFPV